MTAVKLLATLAIAIEILSAHPLFAFPVKKCIKANKLLSQNTPFEDNHTYTLGAFPNKGNIANWKTANEITKDTKDLRKSKNCLEAIKKADQALAIYSYDANLYLDRALSYYQLGVQAETAGDVSGRDKFLHLALQDYNKALESNHDWRLYAGLCKTFTHLGQLSDAVTAANNAIYHSSPLPPTEQRDKLMLLLDELNKRLTEAQKQ